MLEEKNEEYEEEGGEEGIAKDEEDNEAKVRELVDMLEEAFENDLEKEKM